jgi:ABC-type branched-subunit amino acid transport system ATPase component
MKRKLSLAIAYIGNSKLVVLDEPTAGMVGPSFLSPTLIVAALSL